MVNAFSSNMNSLTDRVASLEAEFNLMASGSALLNEDPSSFSASSASQLNLDQLSANNAVISESLSVLGKTTVADLGVTGNISVGLLSIDGLNNSDGSGYAFASINTSAGPLKLQSETINGVDFENGKLTIDTTAVSRQSAIFVTPRTKTNHQLSVTQQTAGTSFTVEVTSSSSEDIKFNWWIVN